MVGSGAIIDVEWLLSEVDRATARLLRSVRRLDDGAVGEGSGLPGWTRGQVLAHLARHADGLGRLVRWAQTGVETPVYASSAERADGIDAGLQGNAAALVADVEHTAVRWYRQAGGLSAVEWRQPVVVWPSDGLVSAAQMLLNRLAEVEIHHVDLAVGYDFTSTPVEVAGALIEACVPRLRAVSPPITVEARDLGRTTVIGAGDGQAPPVRIVGTAASVVGWLTGRSDGAGLVTRSRRGLPRLPVWG